MRVLYLIYTPFRGRASTTVATEGWFQHLRPHGLEPVVVCSHAGHFSDWSRARGIPTYEVPFCVPSKRWPFPFFRMLWKLRRIVKRHGIELIHCNEQERYPVAHYIGRLCAVPVVVSIHCRMGRGFAEWVFGRGRQPDRLFFLTRGSREINRNAVEGIVSESSWRILHNGLDVGFFCPDSERGRQFRLEHGLGNGLLAGTASWLRPGKQLDHLFEAFAKLKHKEATLVIAGGIAPGEEEYAEQLLEKGRQIVGERLRYLGCLPDLRGFYNGLDLCVNTSKEETCSISILEALACGCPVVGYPSVSVDEQVLPCGGEIVEQDNVPALAAAVERWLGNKEQLRSARDGARSRAQDVFDIRRISLQLWDEYQALRADKNGCPRLIA